MSGQLRFLIRERDRLLRRTARIYGLSFSAVSLACLAIPGVLSPSTLTVVTLLHLVLGFAQWLLGLRDTLPRVAVILVTGLAIVILVGSDAEAGSSAADSITHLTAASIASIAFVLTGSWPRIVVLAVAFLATAGTMLLMISNPQAPLSATATIIIGWSLSTMIGIWVRASVPRVARRIASIGRAHRAERDASELEAQRRQSARLLHDTVLATLTLLAHSGVGVSPDALREQAGGDARLLRQLRLGMTTAGLAEDPETVPDSPDVTIGTTLEAVSQRFTRMGLEVTWHGTGQPRLRPEVLDALTLALAECLENVRRHSGVTQAHVTIAEDHDRVRALVTDSGVGFEVAQVPEGRLGLSESVVARLHDIGGLARVFSTPGAGTTVALEVPR